MLTRGVDKGIRRMIGLGIAKPVPTRIDLYPFVLPIFPGHCLRFGTQNLRARPGDVKRNDELRSKCRARLADCALARPAAALENHAADSQVTNIFASPEPPSANIA